MRIGFHYPFSGSLNKLKERIIVNRGNVVHFYIRSLRGVDKYGQPHPIKKISKKQITEFKQFRNEKNIAPMIMHAPYFYNLAKEFHETKNQESIRFIDLVLEDLEQAQLLGVEYYVIQPGYAKDIHPIMAIENIKMALLEVLEKTTWDGMILVKNMAGAGSEVASSLEEWNELISFHPRVKGALDFSRAYAAGYSFTTTEDAHDFYQTVDDLVSWDKIKLVYINDNDRFCGSRKNVFPPLGEGVIGFTGYEDILTYKTIQQINWVVENQPDLTYIDRSIAYLTSFFETGQEENK